MKQKQLYAAPATEVLELRLEGVIATSQTEDTNPILGNSSLDGDWE